MQAGEVLDARFRVERHLGAGSAAQVYRALDLATGETVALKVVRDSEGELADRFQREIEILRDLTHPALPRHVASGKTPQGHLYAALEWLPGEDLRMRLRRGRLTAYESIEIVRRVAEGLAVAHARGVVHRDVKPSNVFLVDGEVERVKVIDFGMARAANLVGLATEHGMILGTPAYMAPEQARSARDADARADVFALGCVLYECLTHLRAFSGATVHEILAKIASDPIPLPSLIEPSVPTELDHIVLRMTAKDPVRRYKDGAEVAAALAALRLSPSVYPRDSASRLAGEEQRVACVVVARAGGAGLAAWESLARAAGGEPQRLDDATWVAAFRATEPVIDLAARAARFALDARASFPAVPLAVATIRETMASSSVHDPLESARARVTEARDPSTAIRLDDTTAGLVEVRFEVSRDARGATLQGERGPTDAGRRLLGKATPCVGRDRELRLLASTFEECVDEGVARAMLVTGAAGVGKSRVRYEFLLGCMARADVWQGRADPSRAGSPLAQLADLLRQVLAIRAHDEPEATTERMRVRLARDLAGEDAVRATEFLCEIIRDPRPAASGPRKEPESARMRAARQSPEVMSDQLVRAWLDVLGAQLARRPLVLVLEDMQWGDLRTMRFVDAALRAYRDRPLFVLGLGRPEVHELFPRLWAERATQEIKLHDLTARASERMIREALGDDVPDAKIEAMVQRASGNPFYLEELVRAVAEGKEDFPETVVAMVQARLERLEPEARKVLRAASVFGQAFWREGVEAILGPRAAASVGSWIDLLEDREWIAPRPSARFPASKEYIFRHALMREGAYAMLTDEARVEGHKQAATWLEEEGEPDASVLADQFARGGEPARAAAHGERAARQAFERDDLVGAIARAERALEGATDAGLRARLRWVQAQALWWSGDLAQVGERALEAARALPKGSDERSQASGVLVSALAQLGRHEEARPWIEELCAGVHASSTRLVAACHACVFLLTAGRHDDAARLFAFVDAEVAARAERDALLTAFVHRTRAAWALYRTGDLAVLLVESELAAEAFDAIADPRASSSSRANVGLAELMLGAFDTAETSLRGALVAAQRLGIDRMAAVTRHNVGVALARQGRHEEAIALQLEAIETLRARSDRRVEGGAWVYVAQSHAALGNLDAAGAAAVRAIETLADFPPILALAWATSAQVRLARGDAAGALEDSGRGAKLLAELGTLAGREETVRLAYAEALEAAGQTVDARDAITTAARELHARAARISNDVWRRSFLENVPENAAIVRLAAKLAAPA